MNEEARDSRLRDYRAKRDFERTSEPAGTDATPSPVGRMYCVQKHAARNLHYDLRLEFDGVLRSWAVPKGPNLDPGQKPLAVEVEDHPIEYGAFEGVIPEGEYGGGTVMLWDAGTWEPIGDADEGYAKGDLKFRLHGEKLRGDWVLVRMKAEKAKPARDWLLIKKQDEEARPVASYNVQAELPFSVASGRTMEEIAADRDAVWTDGGLQTLDDAAAAPRRTARVPDSASLEGARAADLPAKLDPQLCATADSAPEGDDWLHEVKLDGYRLLCRLEGGQARLFTRNGHDWTDRFPIVAQACARIPLDEAFIDGEVVVLDAQGKPDFGGLQNALGGESRRPFTYFVFDVPYAQGHDLCDVPLAERKAFLETVLDAAPSVTPTIRYCEHFTGDGPVVFENAAGLGLEGIISKRARSRYASCRSDSWLKVKATLRHEFVVGGYTDHEGTRSGFGALILGAHDDEGRLVYCGRVGSGFSEMLIEKLAARLRAAEIDESPFADPENDPDAVRAHWVAPEMVAEVEYNGWTREGFLRQPVFLGLREDVDPDDVRRDEAPTRSDPAPNPSPGRKVTSRVTEDAIVEGVRITHAARSVYPEDRVTKRDVAEYYAAVADSILPFLVKRPLSLVRCPLGLAGDAFYQRHVGDGFPGSIRGVPSGAEVDGEPYLLIDDLSGLLSLVQMGVLEFHTWGCREDDLERPDHLIFDLDPGPGLTWEHIVASAVFVRDYLEDLGLASYVKTSGGKGLHIAVPIRRRTGWDEVKSFARGVARQIVRAAPRNFVDTMTKELRRHRVFVDYLRNARGSTAVAAYSTRARPGACVSMPLSWDELSADALPTSYTVRTAPGIIASRDDPWAGFRSPRQSITAAMRRAVGAS